MKCALPGVFMRFFCIGNLKMNLNPKVELYLLIDNCRLNPNS